MEFLQGILGLFFLGSLVYIVFAILRKKPKKVPISVSAGLLVALFLIDMINSGSHDNPMNSKEKKQSLNQTEDKLEFKEIVPLLEKHPYVLYADKVVIKSAEDGHLLIEIHFFENATFMDYALSFKNLTDKIISASDVPKWFYIDIYNGDKYIFRLQYFPHQVFGVYKQNPNQKVIHAIIMNNIQVIKKNSNLKNWYIEQCKTYKGYLDPFCGKVI